MRRRTALMVLLALALTALPGTAAPETAGAQQATQLRIAMLAPRGSPWARVFDAWNNSLRSRTSNRLTLRIFYGGSQGGDRDVITKIRNGQLDGGAVTASGLGLIVRPVLVLQAPGVVRTYAELDRARTAMNTTFSTQFQQNGVHLLGWSDVGEGRIFSTRAIARPRDLVAAHPWVWNEDEMFGEFLTVVGARGGVRLSVPDVLPALTARRIDTFVASASAASALQWHTRVTHVTQQPNSILVGATILSQEKYESLPADLRAALDETSAQAHAALVTRVRRDDARYYTTLTTTGGLQVVNLTPHQAEWDDAQTRTRNNLAGRIYPRPLMEQVMAAARAP